MLIRSYPSARFPIVLLPLLLGLLCAGLLPGQQIDWAVTLPGNLDEQANSIIQDAAGNTYSCGTFTQDLLLLANPFVVSNSPTPEGFVLKYDTDNSFQWAKHLRTSNGATVIPTEVICDASGNVYACGYFTDSLFLDTDTLFSLPGEEDLFLIKYDPAGTELWVYGTNGVGSIRATSMTMDAFGFPTLGGTWMGNKVVNGVTMWPAGNDGDAYLLRINPNGQNPRTILRSDQARNYEIPVHVAADDLGFLYLTFTAVQQFGFYNGVAAYVPPSDSSTVAITRSDTFGTLMGYHLGGGLNDTLPYADQVQDLAVTPSGQLAITGSYKDDLFWRTDTVFAAQNPAQDHAYIAYFDTLAWLFPLKWLYTLEPPVGASNAAFSQGQVLTLTDTSVYMGGAFSNSLVCGTDTLMDSLGQTDGFLLKLDTTGQHQWTQQIPSDAHLYFTDLERSNRGKLVGCGAFSHNFFVNSTAYPSLNTSTPGLTDGFMFLGGDTTMVWPGDANNDYIANNVDLLYVGLGFADTGPPRSVVSNAWQGYFAQNWLGTLPFNTNKKYADCNGDGIINWSDTTAISLNYGLTHAKTHTGGTAGPALWIEFTEDSVMVGDTAIAVVGLGVDTLQAQDIHGAALSLLYDVTYVDSGSIGVKYDQSWLGNQGQDMLTLHKDLYGAGQVDIGISRNDQINRSGYGEIARLTIVMVEDLSGKTELAEVFRMFVTDETLVSANGTFSSAEVGMDSIIIYENPDSRISEQTQHNQLTILPQPAKDWIEIHASQTASRNLEIYDLTGRRMFHQQGSWNRIRLNTQGWPAGLYVLRMQSPLGNQTHRLVIQK